MEEVLAEVDMGMEAMVAEEAEAPRAGGEPSPDPSFSSRHAMLSPALPLPRNHKS